MIELPGVIESGMPRRNGQRKPGTTRGSPRRSRTAKALRIRAMPRNRSVPEGLAHGVVEAEMEPDNITRTGAEDPWGREAFASGMAACAPAVLLGLRTKFSLSERVCEEG